MTTHVLLARIRALRALVRSRLSPRNARYFDPEHVLDLFQTFDGLQSRLHELSEDLFADMTVRGVPHPSGTTDFGGRGYITREQLELLAADLQYCESLLTAEVPEDAGSGRISTPPSATQPRSDPRKVFVVHGRDTKAREGMFSFLRSIGLDPIEWSRAVTLTGKPNPYVAEVLDAAFEHAQAVLVLMTPDDMAKLKRPFITEGDPPYEKVPTPQARPNVLFEAGMAMGRFPKRTVLVQIGDMRPFSDIGGRHVVRLDNSTQKRQDIADRLATAGCTVDLGGREWHTIGDFTAPIEEQGAEGVEWSVGGADETYPPANGDVDPLTEEEILYLLQIAEPQNRGRLVRAALDCTSGRENEKYRDMLCRFVEIGLMREEPSFWVLTTHGYETAEKAQALRQKEGEDWARPRQGKGGEA